MRPVSDNTSCCQMRMSVPTRAVDYTAVWADPVSLLELVLEDLLLLVQGIVVYLVHCFCFGS